MSWALRTVFGFGEFWSDLIGGLLSFAFLAPLHLSQIALAARVADIAVHPLSAGESRAVVAEAVVKDMVLPVFGNALTASKAGAVGPWRPSEYMRAAQPPRRERESGRHRGFSL
jgi:hypothetical protein